MDKPLVINTEFLGIEECNVQIEKCKNLAKELNTELRKLNKFKLKIKVTTVK